MKATAAVLAAIVAVIALLYVATVPNAQPAGLSAGDRVAIDELLASYSAAYQAGDWDAWAALWTPDAVYQIPEAPALVGRDAILADARTQVPGDVNVTIIDSDGSGKWAWARGKWVSLRPATEERPELRMEGSFLWVLEKQPEGTWLIDSETYNLDIPRDPPPEG